MNYWKLKSQLLQVKILEERASNLLKQIDEIKTRAFKEANLEIGKIYDFDDENETIKEITDGIAPRT
jgi:hypothetical protein